jgi:AcrR family transcriptional regulator
VLPRPKVYDSADPLDKTIQVFWKKGFSETSLRDIEKSTRVNKSSLYTEFSDKNDIYMASLAQGDKIDVFVNLLGL